MKLSDWAKKQGISYLTAWRWFKENKLPVRATKMPSGSIIVEELSSSSKKVSIYCRVSSHEKKEDLEGLIRNYTRRAKEIDPLDRLIEIKKDGDRWEVLLTENQLANKLAKKIKGAFKKVKTHVSFGIEPSDVAEVKIEFI